MMMMMMDTANANILFQWQDNEEFLVHERPYYIPAMMMIVIVDVVDVVVDIDVDVDVDDDDFFYLLCLCRRFLHVVVPRAIGMDTVDDWLDTLEVILLHS